MTGALGILGGVLIVYIGLQHTRATSAALVLAAQPLLTAIVLRLRGGPRLSRATTLAIAAALAGVLLVISRGDPASLANDSVGWGILLVLAGQVGWVLYTIDAPSFRGWSPLRFTALTAVPATLLVVALTGLAELGGFAHPSERSLTGAPGLLTYAIVGPALIAVLAWNAGRIRLGAQNVALFSNLIPITTFTIEIVRGYSPRPVEVGGAVLTIGALVANNFVQRRAALSS